MVGLGFEEGEAVVEEAGVGRTMVGAEGGWFTVVGADDDSSWEEMKDCFKDER